MCLVKWTSKGQFHGKEARQITNLHLGLSQTENLTASAVQAQGSSEFDPSMKLKAASLELPCTIFSCRKR